MNTDFTPGADPEEVKIRKYKTNIYYYLSRSNIFFMVLV